jgi:phosphate transport system protein
MTQGRHSFEGKLQELYGSITEMGQMVTGALNLGGQALETGDRKLAETVISGDEQVDSKERELEDHVIVLLGTEGPVASDLRKLVASLKIVSHLERLGDHAVHLAKSGKGVNWKPAGEEREAYFLMLKLVLEMLQTALDAYQLNDAALAVAAAGRDSQIDDLYDRIMYHLTGPATKKQDPADIAILTRLARYLERAGDHVVHICEWIYYAVESRHIDLN